MLYNNSKSVLDAIGKIVSEDRTKYNEERDAIEAKLQLEAMKKMNCEYVVPEGIEKEGVAHFMGAAAAAHKAGKKQFAFGGKVYPVQIKKHIAKQVNKEEVSETKSAPKGYHFTKDGKLKRGDADVDGPGGSKLRSDPLDKTRSKVPPVSEEVELDNSIFSEEELEKLNAISQSLDLDEARGRPRKNPPKPAARKDDDDEDDFGPDTGPEPDQNIVNHLKKSVDTGGTHDVKFADNSTHKVPSHVAHKVLGAMGKLKPADRIEIQKHIHASHKNLMDVHRMIK